MQRQTQSTRILVEVILNMYNEIPSVEIQQQLTSLIFHYIQNPNSFFECCEMSNKMINTSQPIERLRDILNVSNEPIPFDENSQVFDSNSRKKSRTWSTIEDNRLIAGIFRYGIDNWTSISRFVGNGRSRSQCSQRWQRGLDPHLSKDQWSPTEEAYLMQLVSCYGEKSWTQISTKMGNRSDVQCRYRYRQILKEKNLKGFNKNQQTMNPHQNSSPGSLPAFTPLNIQIPNNNLQYQQQNQNNNMSNPSFQNMQQPMFGDNYNMYQMQYNIQGNLRLSQSVPAIQFHHINQTKESIFPQQNATEKKPKQLPPVPPNINKNSSPRPSNGDFTIDMFPDSIFEEFSNQSGILKEETKKPISPPAVHQKRLEKEIFPIPKESYLDNDLFSLF